MIDYFFWWIGAWFCFVVGALASIALCLVLAEFILEKVKNWFNLIDYIKAGYKWKMQEQQKRRGARRQARNKEDSK